MDGIVPILYEQEDKPLVTRVGEMWFKPSEKNFYLWNGEGWSLVAGDGLQSSIDKEIAKLKNKVLTFK